VGTPEATAGTDNTFILVKRLRLRPTLVLRRLVETEVHFGFSISPANNRKTSQ